MGTIRTGVASKAAAGRHKRPTGRGNDAYWAAFTAFQVSMYFCRLLGSCHRIRLSI